MKSYLPIYKFDKGLQTRKPEDFNEPDEFREFLNTRWDGSRRPGQDRILVPTNSAGNCTAMNFNGTNQYATAPSNASVWTLPLKFSLRVLFKQDVHVRTGDEFLIGWGAPGTGPVTLKINSAGKVVFSITDSAAVTTTMTSGLTTTTGTKYSVLVTRNKSDLSMFVTSIGESVISKNVATMSATLKSAAPTADLLFAVNGSAGFPGTTGWYDGDIDHVLLLNTVLSDNNEGFIRIPDPMVDDVLAFYPFDSTTYLYDHSRFGMSGGYGNSPVSATNLCVPEAPVRALGQFDTGDGARMFVVMGRSCLRASL